MIVELGSRLWGPATVNGNEYRFGEDQSKVIDPRKGTWFDFTTNKGGYIKELMKKVETTAHRKQPNADDVVLVCAADVVSRPLDWIWEGHLLRGSQELMSGLPDLSKSTVQISYVACATGRVPWPNGAVAIEPMNVIMLTAEDTLDQIVVPRLCAAGADLNRVSFLKCIKTDDKDRQFLLAEDLDRLECLVQKIGNVGLITIDPITAYMGGRMDSHKATEVRSQLGPLKDFAERTNTALSTITHPAKVAGARALNHFIGSQAFIAACRVGHLCIAEMEERDDQFIPTGRVLFTNVRNTAYRQLMPTLVYRKEEVIVSKEPRLITAPKIVWDGPLDITAEAAIAAASGKKPDQQLKVQAFLHEILKDGKPALQKEIEEAAEVKGFTKKQLRVAREKLGVHVAKKPGKMTGPWFWRLPSHF
jgi:putative DNA primase/helicase